MSFWQTLVNKQNGFTLNDIQTIDPHPKQQQQQINKTITTTIIDACEFQKEIKLITICLEQRNDIALLSTSQTFFFNFLYIFVFLSLEWTNFSFFSSTNVYFKCEKN